MAGNYFGARTTVGCVYPQNSDEMTIGKMHPTLNIFDRFIAIVFFQDLCTKHANDKKDKNYQKFYDDVSKAVNSTGKFKKTVNMLTNVSLIIAQQENDYLELTSDDLLYRNDPK